MLDAGVALAGSSDYPVAGFDVLAAVRAAVTRRTLSGRQLFADQALEVEEVLAAYTRGAARALGVDADASSLTPGKRADVIVLSADPRRVPPDRLGEVKVERTYVAGELVHAVDPDPRPVEGGSPSPGAG